MGSRVPVYKTKWMWGRGVSLHKPTIIFHSLCIVRSAVPREERCKVLLLISWISNVIDQHQVVGTTHSYSSSSPSSSALS